LDLCPDHWLFKPERHPERKAASYSGIHLPCAEYGKVQKPNEFRSCVLTALL
jgi:hypothetical protein